ncbi:MAG: DnaJ domain-containing protein [Polyangiaceae bacterium]|jgi:hypothetical protein|nr:DnaJ domain-containing protein [Polyangiaceae bacterium]
MRVGRHEAEQDFYQLLGVPPGATPGEIRQAHKKLVRLHHPDRSALDQERQRDAEEQMKRINRAASVLLDAEARATYDRLRFAPTERVPRRPAPPAPPAWYDAPPSPPRPAGPPPASPWWSTLSDTLRAGANLPRGNAPVPPAILALALLLPLGLALLGTQLDGPTPVSSSRYRIPKAPERVTMWAP